LESPNVTKPVGWTKVAGTAQLNNVQMARDGSLGTQDTAATMPTTYKLNFGSSADTVGRIIRMRQVMLLPKVSSDAELQSMAAAA
jgi:hypothetical protein